MVLKSISLIKNLINFNNGIFKSAIYLGVNIVKNKNLTL